MDKNKIRWERIVTEGYLIFNGMNMIDDIE